MLNPYAGKVDFCIFSTAKMLVVKHKILLMLDMYRVVGLIPGGIWLYLATVFLNVSVFLAALHILLQCFDTVGWVAGRASRLLKN